MPVIELKDQAGKWVRLESFPRRIISLVPSITELLFDLGLEKEVVGITKFCVRPAHWFRSKPRVGGTKTVSIEKVAGLSPDLIIANKEENIKTQVEALADACPVYTSDISNLEQALGMIKDIGILTGKTTNAWEFATSIKNSFAGLTALEPRVRSCYLVWQNPYISAGGDTFIDDMLERCGFENVFKNQARYPETTIAEILQLNCELLLLSSEPFPFKEKHIPLIWREMEGARNTRQGNKLAIQLVDGEMFSWYGSRLKLAPLYFRQLQTMVITGKSDFSQ